MRKWQATLYAILFTGSLAATEHTAAARKARGGKASADATRLVEEGTEALRKQDYPGARRALGDALRASAGPEVLFQLGRLAVAEGRLAAAQDLMRRFLHDSSGEAEGPLQKEARSILAQPAGAQGEVAVLGARGAVVQVDERPVGSLPLALPLLLPLGPHRVTVELGTQRVEEQVKVLPGQLAEMRFNSAGPSKNRAISATYRRGGIRARVWGAYRHSPRESVRWTLHRGCTTALAGSLPPCSRPASRICERRRTAATERADDGARHAAGLYRGGISQQKGALSCQAPRLVASLSQPSPRFLRPDSRAAARPCR